MKAWLPIGLALIAIAGVTAVEVSRAAADPRCDARMAACTGWHIGHDLRSLLGRSDADEAGRLQQIRAQVDARYPPPVDDGQVHLTQASIDRYNAAAADSGDQVLQDLHHEQQVREDAKVQARAIGDELDRRAATHP